MLKLFNEILVHCQGFFFTEDEQLIKTNANYNNIIDTLYTLNVYILLKIFMMNPQYIKSIPYYLRDSEQTYLIIYFLENISCGVIVNCISEQEEIRQMILRSILVLCLLHTNALSEAHPSYREICMVDRTCYTCFVAHII